MGQKTNPIGLRLGIVKTWDSRWFAKRGYAEMLKEDLLIKRYLKKRLYQAGISRITIERKGEKITIGIKTARPGLVIGRKGEQVDKLSEEMKQLTKKQVQLNIEEIKRADLDAQLVAGDARVGVERHLAEVAGNVRAANADAYDAQLDFIRRRDLGLGAVDAGGKLFVFELFGREMRGCGDGMKSETECND